MIRRERKRPSARAQSAQPNKEADQHALLVVGQDDWHTRRAAAAASGQQLFMTDGPYGVNTASHRRSRQTLATAFPSGFNTAATWDTELSRRLGRAVAQEVRAVGANVILGPCVDIVRHPLAGRAWEALSEDPLLTSRLAVAYIDGAHDERDRDGRRVGVCLKHFACYNQETRRHDYDARVSERALREVHLPAFEACVREADPEAVMTSYNFVNGQHASCNAHLVRDVLRGEWGFAGVVVSDWGGCPELGPALEAGLSLKMPGPVRERELESIARAQQSALRRASEEVSRCAAKLVPCSHSDPPISVRSAERRALAEEIAAESFVLLKNDGSALPIRLDGTDSILLCGPNLLGFRFCGPGSVAIDCSDASAPAHTLLDRIPSSVEVLDASQDPSLLDTASAQTAIVFVGAPASAGEDLFWRPTESRYEGESCDRQSLALPADQDQLIVKASQKAARTIVVINCGGPVAMPWLPLVSSVLFVGYPGCRAASAICSVLFGDTNPCGKTPVTFPRRIEDTPAATTFPFSPGRNPTCRVDYSEGVHVGYSHYAAANIEPLFCFGHGLSYTSFDYSDVEVRPARLSVSDLQHGAVVQVSFLVSNTGCLFGKEVAQVFAKRHVQVDVAAGAEGREEDGGGSWVESAIVSVVEVLPPPINPYAQRITDLSRVGKSSAPSSKRVSVLHLFKFAGPVEVALVLLGTLCSVAQGALIPIYTIFMGRMIDAYQPAIEGSGSGSSGSQRTAHDIDQSAINDNAVYLVILGAVTLCLHFTYVSAMSIGAARQGLRMRRAFVEGVLCQEMGWFDSRSVGELTTRLSDIIKIQEGVGERIGTILQLLSMSVGGWVVAFATGWKLSLVMLSTMPLSVVAMTVCSTIFGKLAEEAATHYARAGMVAEEFLSCIRTVTAFGVQREALDRYDAQLRISRAAGYKRAASAGFAVGFLFLITMCTYGLALWYGSKLAENVTHVVVDGVNTLVREMEPGEIVTVFFGIMMGVENFGQLGPLINTVLEARSCARGVFDIIDRKSQIDPRDEGGVKLELAGDIEFRSVFFRYPTRPEVEILNDFTLSIKSGQTVAFVGPSGCGKSTAVGLLERMYDIPTTFGAILVDGHPINTINLKHLRSQIGVVSQEPVLFAMSIKDNIALGATGPVTLEQIESAAKKANAHDFIAALPMGYDTLVGERGAQLSGGQKQRIAIARALVRRPKLLLFDEATSALDATSERIVQEAIDNISHGVTCIIIAHRLSTVRNADLIVAFKGGRVEEQGSHEQLVAKKGLYYKLLMRQQLAEQQEKKEKAEEALNNREVVEMKEEEESGPQDEESPRKEVKFATVLRAFGVLRPDWIYVLVSSLASVINGAIFPVYALIFSEIVSELFYVPGTGDDTEHHHKISFWAVAFCILGAWTFIGAVTANALIDIAGERQTKYLRYECFKAMMRQEIGWFDDKRNMTGVLTTRLATEATMLHNLTGNQLAVLLSMVSTIAAGVAIAFTGSWKVALVVSAVVPFLGVAAAIDFRRMISYQMELKQAYEDAGQIANQAFENPRTVLVMGRESHFRDQYVDLVKGTVDANSRKAMYSHALAGGLVNSAGMWIAALALWYGGRLVGNPSEGVTFEDVLRAESGMMFGAVAVGQVSAYLPDFGKAIAAAHHIFALLDRQPKVEAPEGLAYARPGQKDSDAQARDRQRRLESRQSATETGSQDGAPQRIQGEIEFRDVVFEYPTRPGQLILRGLSLLARPNQTLALVGASGCGKSTVVSLLERMYDPLSGEVLIDGMRARDIDVSWLRSQIGLVGQEPVLFAATIRENIALGKPGGNATEEEVVAAARAANAHGFISSFPQGYSTPITEKGTNLSGGQKQRIAIARALVRNPRILLLDEATSALDSASEAVVQDALDRARGGRTTIVIAHRLSTVVAADKIAVIDKGVVVETGTHTELMQLQGHYFNLVTQAVWRAASEEMAHKSASLREACRALALRAADAARHVAALAECLKQVPSYLAMEEPAMSALWAAMYQGQCAQSAAEMAFSLTLDESSKRLLGVADTFDLRVSSLAKKAEVAFAQLAEVRARAAEDKERLAVLFVEHEQRKVAEKEETSLKRRSKYHKEVEKLAEEVAQAEAKSLASQSAYRDAEETHKNAIMPSLMDDFESAMMMRMNGMREVLSDISRAESERSTAIGNSLSPVTSAIAMHSEGADLSDMITRIQNARPTPASSPTNPRSCKSLPQSPSRSPPPSIGSPPASPSPGGSPHLRLSLSGSTGSLGSSQQMPQTRPRRDSRIVGLMRSFSLARVAVPPPQPHAAASSNASQSWSEAEKTVKQLVDRVIELGGQTTEGIFRLSPKLTEVEAAMEAMESSGELPRTAHLAGSVLKRWLTNKLPETLIPPAQYVAAIEREEPPLAVLETLPETHKSILETVVRFLQVMAKPENEEHTKMGISNLATVFAPCIMRTPNQLCQQQQVGGVATEAFIFAERECKFLMRLITDMDPTASPMSARSEPGSSTCGRSSLSMSMPLLPEGEAKTARNSGTSALWYESIDELQRKAASLHEACEALGRRASDASKTAAALTETLKVAPTQLWLEESSVNCLWRAMYEAQGAQAIAASRLAEKLTACHNRLCALLRRRGEKIAEELAASKDKVAAGREALARLWSDLEHTKLAYEHEQSQKKRAKLSKSAQRLADEVSACEARCLEDITAGRDLEERHRASDLPALQRDIDAALLSRLTELQAVLQGVREAESAWVKSLRSAVKSSSRAPQVAPESDLAEMNAKLVAARPTVLVLPSSPRCSRPPPSPRSPLSSPRVSPHSLSLPPSPSPSVSPPPPMTCASNLQRETSASTPGSPQMRARMSLTGIIRKRSLSVASARWATSTLMTQPWGLSTLVVRQLIERVVELGGLHAEGIFRLSLSVTDVDAAMDAMDRGELPVTAHLAAVVLKKWLTSRLPEPLIPPAQYIAAIIREEPPIAVVESLPETHRNILEHLVRLLQVMARPENVEHTRMNAVNLATVLAPCIMRTPSEMCAAHSRQVGGVVTEAFVLAEREVTFLMRLIKDMCLTPPASPPGTGELPGGFEMRPRAGSDMTGTFTITAPAAPSVTPANL
eukprot:m51a1_g1562 putative multidrug resistance protein 1-like (3087) ;mRNA; r:38021-50690